MQVRHVASVVALGRQCAVLLARWLEMPTRGGERRLALADRMDVKSVLARRQTFDRKINQHAGRSLRQLRRTDVPAVGAVERGTRALCRRRRRCDGHQHRDSDADFDELSNFHGRPHAFPFYYQDIVFGARLYV